MKKLFSLAGLILIILALSTVGCEKDKTPEELLAGKWEIQSLNMKLYINNVLDDEATETYDANEMVLEFIAGGTGKEYYDGTEEGTFSWSISGDKVTVTFSGEDPMVFTFTVDENTLKFWLEESETDPESGDVYKIVMTFTAKRV